jgi:predicted ATPase
LLEELKGPVISSVISHYRILSTLGAGGMGEVYLAEDTRLERLVAIKFLRAELTKDVSRLRRFEQEARAISALNHPNIVTIFEIGEVNAGRFIVLEYVKGRTLRAVISNRPEPKSVPAIGRQVASALAVAHQAGLIHRDVKPENIMLRDDGYVKVLDFGLARLTSSEGSHESTADTAMQTRPGMLVGTVAYMSPEQVKADTVGTSSDIFSLGAVLYELATGRKPFKSASEVAVMHQIAYDQPPAPTTLNPDLPLSLETLILAMLDKSAQSRPTAADVAAALANEEPSTSVASAAIAPVPRAARRTVGRSMERERLRAAFHSAAAGRGLMLCVTGETGLGKTTLVEDFLSDIRQADPPAVIARGRCSERLAGAEAYLPLLEALDGLIGVETPAALTMKTLAPSWYIQFAMSRDASVERIITESPTVSQERMKRELVAFLQAISNDGPLVLFFDDLHWADTSTVDMIAYLAMKLASMRLLVVATYRRSEMLLNKHPFLAVVLDLQARGICQELPLELLAREDVEQYLGLEFPQHEFPREFASLIYAKTEGNPLFMTDVVRYLRDRKVIGTKNGRWALVQTVPEIETDLPQTVRSLIQRKISQLDDVDRRVLLGASAQGYNFDSAAVARALKMDASEVEERLQSLEYTHGFVTLREEEELPDHTLTVKYRFVHVLYQNALYGTLTPSRRAALSASIADALLAFYGERSSDIASELALLLQTARDWPRAAEYFLKAARNAARIFANQEAISLCQRGLNVNRRAPDTPDRARLELKLQMTLGFCLMTVKGFAATDTLRTFLRAEELCQQLGDPTQLFRVLFGLSIVSVVRAEYAKARRFAEECLRDAERTNDGAQLVQANWALGLTLQLMGDFTGSRAHLERSVALYDPRKHAARAFLYGGILNRMHLARALLHLGYASQAEALAREGLHAAENMRHPVGLVNTLSVAVTIEAFHRNTSRIIEMADKILFHADEHGLPYYAAIATIMRGWAKAIETDVDAGCAEMRAGLAAHRDLETEQQRAYYLVLMADALCAAGRVDDGLHVLDEAVAAVNASDEHFCEAELYRIRGDLLVRDARPDEAGAYFRRAIGVAQAQCAKALELRGVMGLARLSAATGQRDLARAMLHPVFEWFTEGFDTHDLRAARSLLAELS